MAFTEVEMMIWLWLGLVTIHIWVSEKKHFATFFQARNVCLKSNPSFGGLHLGNELSLEIPCNSLLVWWLPEMDVVVNFAAKSCFIEGCLCVYTESKLFWYDLTRTDSQNKAEILLFFSSCILVTKLGSVQGFCSKCTPLCFERRAISNYCFQWRSVTNFLASPKYKICPTFPSEL